MRVTRKMKKAYIWGAGKQFTKVYNAVNKDYCMVLGVIDSDPNKRGKFIEDQFVISSPDLLRHSEFDAVIISTKDYRMILNECKSMGIDNSKIIIFWKPRQTSLYIDCNAKRILELEEELEKYKARLENLPYELYVKPAPNVRSAEELLNLIIDKKLSLCRFGDGEFDIMRNKKCSWFQNQDSSLSGRLKEIVRSRHPDIMIAVADNFGSLEKYTEKAADEIRQYLYGNTRKEIMEFLDLKHVYYDAYVTRPYILYKDKVYSKYIFELLKKVWNNREILVVEGKYTRMGIDNGLFDNARRVRRILCPEKNAYTRYREIIKTIQETAAEDELVLVSLGPTATVLAYDVAREGVQALDIGQVDNEYEWFLRGAKDRIEIPGKGVAELSGYHCPSDIDIDFIYEEQIIKRIG